MKVKHGVLPTAEGPLECWWVGEKVEPAEFTRRLHDQTAMVGRNLAEMLVGIEQKFVEGKKASTELELIEKILKGPLCEVCKMMIENMKP